MKSRAVIKSIKNKSFTQTDSNLLKMRLTFDEKQDEKLILVDILGVIGQLGGISAVIIGVL